MKKILSIFLILTIGSSSAFAQLQNQPTITQTPPGISNDEYIANVEIIKEPIRLKSELNKKYSGYSYTITNFENDPILLESIGYAIAPKTALYYTKANRQKERFPRVFLLPISKCGDIATEGAMLISAIIFPPLAFACFMGLTDNPKPKVEDGFYNYCLLPIKNTFLMPYYWIKDPKENKKEIEESAQFNGSFKNITIQPKEKIQLAVLVEPLHYKSYYNKEICDGIILIRLKNVKTEQRYTINK